MTSPVAWSVQTQWPPDPRHVGDARRFVADRLLADDLGDLADTVSLIVSELTTNAVRHARSSFRVTVSRSGSLVLVEVRDDSPAPAFLRDGEPFALSGRGLHLVETLSTEWGMTRHAQGGKSVWASLDLADPGISA